MNKTETKKINRLECYVLGPLANRIEKAEEEVRQMKLWYAKLHSMFKEFTNSPLEPAPWKTDVGMETRMLNKIFSNKHLIKMLSEDTQ